jgi:DNA-binding IscR family transcriptional regulator
MNAIALEPSAIGEFIFGDQLLHSRFSAAIELLVRLVIAHPRPVTTAALCETIGQTPRQVRALLNNLHQSGLLYQDEKNKDTWHCPPSLNAVTLADVFRSVVTVMPEASASRRAKRDVVTSDEVRSAAQQSVDLLLMQATMAINQVVQQHLQAFDLGRLKAVASSASLRMFSSSVRSYIAEPV